MLLVGHLADRTEVTAAHRMSGSAATLLTEFKEQQHGS
ncbi:hypothetical protein RCH09_001552 [Actimicrobium sp. GrIS 1.19]|nr:hypothetical protein [Actimicrobium sp. GrIS 1.19]